MGVLENRMVRRLCIEDVGMASSLPGPKHFVWTTEGRDVVWSRSPLTRNTVPMTWVGLDKHPAHMREFPCGDRLDANEDSVGVRPDSVSSR